MRESFIGLFTRDQQDQRTRETLFVFNYPMCTSDHVLTGSKVIRSIFVSDVFFFLSFFYAHDHDHHHHRSS